MRNTEPFILLVDDDDDDHYLLKSAIMEILPNAKTQSLYDGREAVNFLLAIGQDENAPREKPDLIFMDLNMPKLNGFQAADLLKNYPHLKDIPIIILSTSSEVPEMGKLLNLVNGFYSKPAHSAALITIIIEVKRNFLGSQYY